MPEPVGKAEGAEVQDGSSLEDRKGAPPKPAPYMMDKRKRQMEKLAKAIEAGPQPHGVLAKQDSKEDDEGGDSEGGEEPNDAGSEGEEGADTIRGVAKKRWNKLRNLTIKREKTPGHSKGEDDGSAMATFDRMKSLRFV